MRSSVLGVVAVEERRNAIYRDSTPKSRSQTNDRITALVNEATTRINTVFAGSKTATDALQAIRPLVAHRSGSAGASPPSGTTTTITVDALVRKK